MGAPSCVFAQEKKQQVNTRPRCVSAYRCEECDINGMKKCETCKGKRMVLTYIKLKVEW